MKFLRLVPPVWFLLALGLAIVLHRELPVVQLISAPWHWLGLLCLVPAALLGARGARALTSRKTTLNPYGEPTALVTDGPYRISRNPLYLSLALVLTGVAWFMGSLTPFLVVPAFMAVITALFIRREEAALAAAFGDSYRDYCGRVRRWL